MMNVNFVQTVENVLGMEDKSKVNPRDLDPCIQNHFWLDTKLRLIFLETNLHNAR